MLAKGKDYWITASAVVQYRNACHVALPKFMCRLVRIKSLVAYRTTREHPAPKVIWKTGETVKLEWGQYDTAHSSKTEYQVGHLLTRLYVVLGVNVHSVCAGLYDINIYLPVVSLDPRKPGQAS